MKKNKNPNKLFVNAIIGDRINLLDYPEIVGQKFVDAILELKQNSSPNNGVYVVTEVGNKSVPFKVVRKNKK